MLNLSEYIFWRMNKKWTHHILFIQNQMGWLDVPLSIKSLVLWVCALDQTITLRVALWGTPTVCHSSSGVSCGVNVDWTLKIQGDTGCPLHLSTFVGIRLRCRSIRGWKRTRSEGHSLLLITHSCGYVRDCGFPVVGPLHHTRSEWLGPQTDTHSKYSTFWKTKSFLPLGAIKN